MINKRQVVFDQFLSSGFATVNNLEEWEKNFRHIASVYDWNFSIHLPKNKQARILDLGCGAGQLLYWLKQKGYENFLGVDISPEVIEFCHSHVTSQAEKINSVQEFLADKENEYDFMTMNDVIEHLPKDEIIDDLKIMKKALKPGGKLIVKTNNVSAITGARMRFEDFTHEFSFTEYSLRQVLRVAGFKNIIIHPYKYPLTSWKRKARFALTSALHGLWKACFWLEYTTVPKVVTEFMYAEVKKEE